MTVPATQTTQLYCTNCSHWIGESSAPLIFVGMFQSPQDRNNVPEPRDTYRCGSCKWVTIFRRAATHGGDWRMVELKQKTG